MAILSGSILSFLILSLVLKPGVLNGQSLECDLGDFGALNRFHEHLDIPIDGWDGPVSGCCHRPGVICEGSTDIPSRPVVGIVLANRRLKGGVADSLAELDHLRVLNLSRNLLDGSLPAKLFQMQNLEVLDLSYNDFGGLFPINIDLPSVKSFNLSDNNFVGPIEAKALCQHSPSYIKALDLSRNDFQGEIPTTIADCSSLRHLFLNGNNLSGSLPEGIFQLRNLQELNLQGNGFSGAINDRISKLVKLVKLDISDNYFSGEIPDCFSGFIKLEHFSASSNRLSGPLPASISSSPSISVLSLGSNSLTGPISINCSLMLRITSLELFSNSFDGPIPEELSTCRGLKSLSLGENNLSDLPSGFRNLKGLMHLHLANARLVNLSRALETLQHCKNLRTLSLPRNFMNEEIPQNRDLRFRRLKILLIANSQLRGSLPVWLHGCTNLQVLDLSRNQFSGTIPSWIGELSHLFYLDLSLNYFVGDIPESFGKLGNLTNLNFSSLVDPSSSFSVYRSIPGRRSLHYNGIWSLPPTIDLSNNELTGPILPGLGNLKGLHMLKLSNNSFSGTIPGSLSGMKNLELMDLSLNNLSGEIPPALISLNFLSNFNVSFNKLHGEVPSGGQFQTFPISCFIGNRDLCGLPLAPCLPGSGQSNAKRYKEPPSLAEERSVMEYLRPSFEIGAAAGFVGTVGFCFLSGLGSLNTRFLGFFFVEFAWSASWCYDPVNTI